VAEISYLLGSKDRVTQILFSEVLRLASLHVLVPAMLQRFLKTSVLNSSASEDLTAEYDGTEETHAHAPALRLYMGLMTTNTDISLNLES